MGTAEGGPPELPIPVGNEYGWTTTIPNPVTRRFLDYIRALPAATVIDVGAGLGVATLAALRMGAQVTVNDIADHQLEHIQAEAHRDQIAERLTCLKGTWQQLPWMRRTFDAVHASNVFHFLDEIEMARALTWSQASLKAQGKLFIQTQSPYTGHLRQFLPEYERRRDRGDPWPGLIRDPKAYADLAVAEMMPSLVHVLEQHTLKALMRAAAFNVDYCEYYRRPGLPVVCWLDGRENLGAVGTKCTAD